MYYDMQHMGPQGPRYERSKLIAGYPPTPPPPWGISFSQSAHCVPASSPRVYSQSVLSPNSLVAFVSVVS